jgi:hypothetical protein
MGRIQLEWKRVADDDNHFVATYGEFRIYQRKVIGEQSWNYSIHLRGKSLLYNWSDKSRKHCREMAEDDLTTLIDYAVQAHAQATEVGHG